MLKSVQHLALAKPGLGATQRAGLLTVATGPPQGPVERRVRQVPLADLALAGVTSAFRMAMTTGPMVAVERAADAALGGPPTTPAQVDAHRRAVLAGTAATIALGLVTQRLANHSGHSGPLAQASRALGAQLAVGGAASALVIGTDLVLGESGRQKVSSPATALTLGGLLAATQARAMRRIAPRLTLPMPPRTVTIPVRSGRRTGDVQLPLAR